MALAIINGLMAASILATGFKISRMDSEFLSGLTQGSLKATSRKTINTDTEFINTKTRADILAPGSTTSNMDLVCMSPVKAKETLDAGEMANLRMLLPLMLFFLCKLDKQMLAPIYKRQKRTLTSLQATHSSFSKQTVTSKKRVVSMRKCWCTTTHW